MELFKELLKEILYEEEKVIRIEFDISEKKILKAIDSKCFEALAKIKRIIQNEMLSDFEAIEEIVSLFENMNIDFGERHDFG